MIELPQLYHLALAEDWDPAATAPYEISTIGRTLAEEGFIHLSLARQVAGVARAFYLGREVVLLSLDPHRLSARVEFEPAAGSDERYPHLYGPIPRAAIVAATPVPLQADGDHDFGGLLPDPI